MFPLRWNFPFRKKDGSMTTVDEALGGGTYELPPATADTLGGIKVGSGLSLAEGVLSVSSSGGGGHCYSINTDVSSMNNMLLFTKYDGEINSGATLMSALVESGSVIGIMIPWSTTIVKDGKLTIQAYAATSSSIIIQKVSVSNSSFTRQTESINGLTISTVTSSKLW